MAFRDGVDFCSAAAGIFRLVMAEKLAETGPMKSWASKVLYEACRQLEHFVIPSVSVRAQQEADLREVGALHQYAYKDQENRMKDVGRKVFRFEHVLPVSQIKEKLLAEATTVEGVERIIRLTKVAWVLKEEDDRLTQFGYRSKRPDDPWEAYKKCDIEMLVTPGC